LAWTPRLEGEPGAQTIADWCSLDAEFPVRDGVAIRYSAGSFATIDDFAPRTATVADGESLTLNPGGGRSSSEVLPFFHIELDDFSIVLAIGWTGEWFLTVDVRHGRVRLRAGVSETKFRLDAGESVVGASLAVLFAEAQDFAAATNAWRRYVLAHHRPSSKSGPVRPALSCATWGATPSDVHEAVVRQLADEGLGFERYWIDAGWFGQDEEWWANVGSWSANHGIWPDGLRPISDLVHEQGRQLVLWFEPERVCVGSDWHREHPEWMLHVPNELRVERVVARSDPRWVEHESRRTEIQGGEGLYNLGDPAARAFLIDFVSDRITEWGIDVYRHDFNFAPLSFWRANDAADRQGISELRYINGLYEYFDELARRHPGIEFDNCASGGRRIDLNMMRRATPLSRSDYVTDPVGHQSHTFALSPWLPLHATLSHAGFSRYALRSAMTSGLSVSWATDFNRPETGPMELDFDAFRDFLAEFDGVRDAFLGDFHPLTEYSTSEADWLGYQFHDPGTGDGIALAFRRSEAVDDSLEVRLAGLDPDATYRVLTDATPPRSARGSELAAGLTIVISERPAAALVRYITEPKKDE
jgi:alpha-galactosidase